jgi:hypothetical protein
MTPPPSHDDLDAVRRAADGLLYPSESDEPVEVFRWPATAGRSARDAVAAHEPPGEPIDEQPAAEFFDRLRHTTDAEGFDALRRALEAAVADLRVFRVGEVSIAIYVIGKARDGEWAGVRTVSVET